VVQEACATDSASDGDVAGRWPTIQTGHHRVVEAVHGVVDTADEAGLDVNAQRNFSTRRVHPEAVHA
jgi:hypothetical protein